MSHFRKKAHIRQSQPINPKRKQWQPEADNALYKNQFELEWYRVLYENIPCICFTVNSVGRILAVSQFAAACLGYNATELSQRAVTSIFHQEDQTKCQAKLANLQQQPNQISEWEVRLVCKNGNILWAKAVARVVPQTQSQPIISLVCEDLTDIKRKFEALQQSEELHRLTLNTISDTVFITDRTGAFTFICPNVEVIFGYSWQETLGLGNIVNLLGEHLFDWQELERCQEIQNIKREITDKTGRRHTLLVNVKRVSIKEGTLLYSCRDITTRQQAEDELEQYRHHLETRVAERTAKLLQANEQLQQEIAERKRAEEALRESEARFRAAVEGSLDSFFVFQSLRDETGRIEDFTFVDLNTNGEKLISMSKQDVIGKKLCELLPINRTGGFFEKYVQVVETGEVLEEEFPLRTPEVKAAWLHHQVVPLADGIAITTRDITERKQAEAALRENASRLKLALEAAQMGTWDWNMVTHEFVCSDQLGPVFGLPSGTCHPSYNAFLKAVHPEDREYVARAMTHAIEQGADYGVEFRVTWPDGSLHWVGNKGQVYCDDAGKPTRMIGVAMNITERKQAEEALRQQVQRERLVGAISGRIRRSLKLEKILKATVAEVRQVLQTDRVIIFRFEPDWSGKVVVESVSSSRFSILGKNIYDPCFKNTYVELYQQGRVKASDDIYTANLSQCHIDFLEQLQVRANLVAPILKQQQLWGLLVAHDCEEPRQWQPGEIDLLSALAAQAAIAIQHSQLYEQTKSHYLREQLLNQLTQAIRSSLDLETIFATAVRKIGELLQVDHAYIVQYLPEQKVWLNVSEYRKSLDLPGAVGSKILDENNQIAQRLKRLEIVKIHDADTCEDEINKDFAKTFPGAWLMVPLHFGSTVWGSLSLVKNVCPYHWQESDVQLICAVANQVAIAIQQAELYQQSRTTTAQALIQAQQLEQALMKLQNAQTQLVQSEKMSSLGQLVAGVAHEINNPVSFIYGNLVHANGYTNDLLHLIDLYQQHYPNPVPEIQWEIEEIDLEFLMEDLPKLLLSMKVGAERICEIVAALRNFSRVSEADVKAVDLHEGLDSTLMILHNRLKASGKHPEIKVIREYGNLPLVECYVGQLNQVFMNLLVNAVDAIDEQNQRRSLEEVQANPSFIQVRTELISDRIVEIRISDNGPGMTEDVKARLFDPFFTTKPVGTGTGLGLSISYQIVVEKHGGQLHYYSELGQGTEFVIQIPLTQGAKG
jgi:PAS domain S-box-containing protein